MRSLTDFTRKRKQQKQLGNDFFAKDDIFSQAAIKM
jgi:hypothetical protein